MIDTAARALLSVGCFVAAGSGLMLLGTAAGTAEHLVSVLSLVLGIAAIIASAAVLRFRIVRSLQDLQGTGTAGPDDDPVVPTKEHP